MTIKNFLSYKDEAVFSFLANSDTDKPSNLIEDDSFPAGRLLKVAAVYGANASGKTNLIRALATVRQYLMSGVSLQTGAALPGFVPFKLNPQNMVQPCEIEIMFIQNGVRYAYGLAASASALHSEYLFAWPNGRKSVVFERIGEQFAFTKDKKEQSTLSRRTHALAPYLAVATQWNYEPVASAFAWFRDRLKVSLPEHMEQWFAYSASKTATKHDDFLGMLKAADFRITDISAQSRKPREHEIPPVFSDTVMATLQNTELWDVFTQHPGVGPKGQSESVRFHMNEESLGTRRFFELLGPWLDVLENDYVLAFDELDSSLHPLLVEHLVRAFNTKSKRAQLLFSTHNTNLLESEILRRDQFWISDTDLESHGTKLFSLSDLKIRKDHNMEKGYLAGKYGGIPVPEAP